MGSASVDGGHAAGERLSRLFSEPNRRLRLAAAMLVVTGLLGLSVATGALLAPAGEGLGDLLREPKADVMGQVKLADGTPVAGATVSAEEGSGTTVTGLAGWYFLEDVPTGRIQMRMVAPGYRTVLRTVDLERGQYVVDFVAVPGTGEMEVEDPAVPGAGDPSTGRGFLVVAIVICSVAALMGGVLAWRQLRFHMVMLGAVLGMLTWGWFLGSVLSLLALVIVLPLRREFRERSQGTPRPWHGPPHAPLAEPDDGPIEVSADGYRTTEGSGADRGNGT